ncbi:MAG: PqqD family protein [Planctomycetes bacterium]|nr:PqqD family protein [Planctomycetota bacterium]
MKIESVRIIERLDGVPFQRVGDETIIVEPKTRLMHSLNEVASYIWESLAVKRSVSEMVDIITAEYEITKEDALKDVIAFLDEMAQRGLVKVC